MHFHSYLQHPGVFQPRLQDLKMKLSLLFTAFQSCLALAPGSEYVLVLFSVIIYCIPELASPGSRVRKTLELWYEDVSLIIDCVRVAPLKCSS